MTAKLITENIWRHLTSSVKKSKVKSCIAVAYFGKDGSKMLPLSKESILIVDASEKAVKSGQTCPNELLKLYYKGVHIYSLQNLHAKLFVVGKTLFIGSTNVSAHSSDMLTEALYETTEKKSITDAIHFIKTLCTVELGPKLLNRLQKKYHTPHIVGEKKSNSNKIKNTKVDSSSFYTYQLELMNLSEYEQKQSDLGLIEAKKMRINKSRHIIEQFIWEGNFIPKKNDIILQIVEEGHSTYVSPPGILIHTRKLRTGNKKILCYLEIPDKKRKNIKWVNQKLGKIEGRSIKRTGKQSRAFATKMYSLWNEENNY